MTPEELNAITARVAEELEPKLEPLAAAYARLLRGAGRKMARRVRTLSLTAAVLPPDEDEVIPTELREQVDRVTRRERAELVKLLIEAYASQEIAWNVHATITPELLAKVGAHSTFAAERELRDIYRGVIADATQRGLSIPHTAREITAAVDGVAGHRATALARTDMIGLANGASQAAATEAFAGRDDVLKVWLATEDDRTRETHAAANGQEVPLNAYFDVGGFPALYPGDPELPDEEVINCRCTLVYSGGSPAEEAAAEEGEEGVTAAVVRPDTYAAGMPWHIEENHSSCSEGQPFAVVKDADGEVEGCHSSRAAAERQMAALYASEEETVSEPVTAAVTITVSDDSPEAAERQRVPWEGILAIAGSPTSDGRYLIPGEIGQRDLPLPLAASHDDQHATETVGRIEVIEHIPVTEFAKPEWELPDDLPPHAVVVWGEGSFDGSPAAEEALRQLENGVGVSLDLPVERKALIDATTFEEVNPAEVLSDEDVMGVLFGAMPEGYLLGIGGKIGGLSLASIAAFEETTIRIADEAAVVASGFAIRQPTEPQSFLDLFERGLVSERDYQALTASISPPLEPPRDWFFVEEADEPTPITILPTGQFYGHLALWNTCHAGRASGAFSACMYAPHSRTGYSQFHLGSILCDDGSEVAIGRFTIGTGHAPLHLGAAAARKHYDHSGTCVAFGRAKDGVFGIWVCGVLKSDATPEAIRDFRACPPSGDWRMHDGALELQAALAVNAPGYPVPRAQLALAASAADSLAPSALVLGPPTADDFREALQAEYGLLDAEGPAMLVDIGAARFELSRVE